MTAGRPKKTIKDLPENWKEEIIRMGKEGRSLSAIKSYLCMGNDTFERFREDEKEFQETVNEFLVHSEEWWQEQARQGLFNHYQGSSLNTNLWTINMKNRFGWKDKTESDVNVNGSFKVIIEE